MELIDGRPLNEMSRSLGLRERARLLQELSHALADAHARGIIHRDLKPANVLVTAGNRIKILDFGLAINSGALPGSAGEFSGSPSYASPEQAAGEPLTVASDVFSLGSMIFKLLTGRKPFPGSSVDEVLEKVRLCNPPFPRDVAARIPLDLQSICLACLSWDPDKRPTADEVASDLARYLAGEPIRLRPALYGDILRQKISRISRDLQNWRHQGMISDEEHDRLLVVHRRILTDEDHWIVDARRLSVMQTLLYTCTWLVVTASGLLVWLVRDELSPTMQWLAPVAAAAFLTIVGFLAEKRGERLAAAPFLAAAVLSLVPAVLACLAASGIWAEPPRDVTQLFGESFTNLQVCVATWSGLLFSGLSLARLRLTGFAWTTASLTVAGYLSALLLFNWLDREADIMALWCLPLVGLELAALRLEKVGRVRWASPFHLAALLALIASLDTIAFAAPTLDWFGLNSVTFPLLNFERQTAYSLALNGLLFLGLMLLTEQTRSLDLRRISRVLEVLALLHMLTPLYLNALYQEPDALQWLDVALYLFAATILVVLGPWRSRWRLLVGSLGGLAFGCYLLIELEIVAQAPFVMSLGAASLVIAIATFIMLLRSTNRAR
jgi:hypothetical protein